MTIHRFPHPTPRAPAPLTLRPAGLDRFAVVARSGAVLAVVTRADASHALRTLTLRSAVSARPTLSALLPAA